VRTLTIEDLIKKLENKRFARDFKTLSEKCASDRDNLLEKGVNDPAAAKRFLTSWGKFHRRFPFDPTSLAALMVPLSKDYENYKDYCPTETGNLALLSGTQVLHVYLCGKQRQRKPAAKKSSKKK
jgi:hypothetical protein